MPFPASGGCLPFLIHGPFLCLQSTSLGLSFHHHVFSDRDPLALSYEDLVMTLGSPRWSRVMSQLTSFLSSHQQTLFCQEAASLQVLGIRTVASYGGHSLVDYRSGPWPPSGHPPLLPSHNQKKQNTKFLTKSVLLPRYIMWAISHQALMCSICRKIKTSSPLELPYSMVRTGWNCTGVASYHEVWTLQCAPDLTSPSHPSVPETSSQLTLRPNWCFLLKCLLTEKIRWKQPRWPSADEWIRKLWYIYTMEYYSAIKKNSFESVLMRWMKLEPIIESEVSQKDKDYYNILTHIYGIYKDVNDNPICRTEKKKSQIYRTVF